MRMSENGNEKCSLMLVLVFGACFHLPFVAFCCSSLLFLVFEIESILSKNQNRQIPFVARYGLLLLVLAFCGCFHLSIALLVVAFCSYEKPKRATKGKNVQMETGFTGFSLLLMSTTFHRSGVEANE